MVLNDLTKSAASNRVRQTKECEQAFRDLKHAICSESVLHSLDFEKPFWILRNLSSVAVGGGGEKASRVLELEAAGQRDKILNHQEGVLGDEVGH